MSMIESVTLREPGDVERRVAELRLGSVARLLKVAAIANAAGADATPDGRKPTPRLPLPTPRTRPRRGSVEGRYVAGGRSQVRGK